MLNTVKITISAFSSNFDLRELSTHMYVCIKCYVCMYVCINQSKELEPEQTNQNKN